MTRDEACMVAAIMMEADNGCTVCAQKLHAKLVHRMPRDDWHEIIDGVWKADGRSGVPASVFEEEESDG